MTPQAAGGWADSHRPRIRARFTLLYAITLLTVLLGAAAVLRFALHGTLQREFEESVRASAGLVTQFFRTEVNEYRTIEATLTHIAGELVFEDRVIRYRRPDGTQFRSGAFIAPPSRRRSPEVTRTVQFPLDRDLAPGWTVEVDASLANIRALQARVDRWFLVGIPLFVVCAAVAGWWLTGRTLQPVGAMATAAARIAPASGVRLPINDPEDELGRLGARFNALLDRLDGALSQQRQFLADAAHELRTPIARMRARVELALLDGPSSNPTVLEAIERELRSMSQQVDELMQLARADAAGDGGIAEPQGLFLDDLLADEAPRWQPQAQQLGLRLSIEAIEETPVRGEAALLARLMGVLVDNALRYGTAGGTVRLAVRPENGFARLDVEDDGPGVPPADRGRVFDRFFRGESARTQRADGSGLGLAIAAWIVRRHQGQIEVGESDLGGARFTVRLPLAA